MTDINNLGRLPFNKFLATEEENLIASLTNFRKEFDYFYTLDEIYKAPISRLRPSDENAIIPQLYFFVHYHFFSSTTNILRCHLSDALGLTRKAIDAAFTAYEIIEDPSMGKDYINGSNKFNSIKRHIQNSRKSDPNKYPLASELIKTHEACSQFGSHADFKTFAHRMSFAKNDSDESVVIFDYFQKPKDDNEFRYYFLHIIHSFLLMFEIFNLFFKKELKVIDVSWEKKILELHKRLPSAQQRYYQEFTKHVKNK